MKFKLNLMECIDLVYKDIMDNENPENFTEEFNKMLVDVIWKIREVKE